MLRCQKIFIVLICLSILASVISSYAEEEIEDLVDIYESNHQIIAILEGSKTVTSDRLLTFEASSSNWNEHRLN